MGRFIMNIQLLLERYLGMFGIMNKTMVYKNPTLGDLRNMKSEGVKDIRFIVHLPTKSVYIWNAYDTIHYKVQNDLVEKGEVTSDKLKMCEYNHPDWVCGQGRIGLGKIEYSSRDWGEYGNREDDLRGSYSKYFYKKSLK